MRARSQAGRVLERILELDFVVSKLSVPWNALTIDEVKGLQILTEERNLLQQERMDRDRADQEAEVGEMKKQRDAQVLDKGEF